MLEEEKQNFYYLIESVYIFVKWENCVKANLILKVKN